MVFGERFYTNPRYRVPDWLWPLIRLWRLSQGGTGIGHLPEGPASLDQNPALMEAFAILSSAEAELREDESPGHWSQSDLDAYEIAREKALALYPDGKAEGALLEAVLKSRGVRNGD